MNKRILLTGVTGFLGAHLCINFLENGYDVIALKRRTSDTWRCQSFIDRIKLLDTDIEGWQDHVISSQPTFIIHTAWNGVSAEFRNDLNRQLENLHLVADLLQIAKEASVERFVGLGSQAEYGLLNEIANEERILKTDTAYGMSKVLAGNLVGQFCSLNGIKWYWLRVFSIFGEMESEKWLIPSVIKKMLQNEAVVEFSPATQKYAYMYVRDFVKFVYAIVDTSPCPESGIYNISSQNAQSLKSIIEKIKLLCGKENIVLDFGKLPFRDSQSMHIEGSMNKFYEKIKFIDTSDFEDSLRKTVNFYLNCFQNVK